eukprot:Skav227348  [mRNA]  locus=scaffold1665:100674:102299:+ [translate_table: standard]
MTFCPILSALCVGISEYECKGLKPLLGARRDAENFATSLCARKLPEDKLHFLVGKVLKSDLDDLICQFINTIRSSPSSSAPVLVFVFIAGHGKQPASNQLPAIFTSDTRSPEHDDDLVDLDRSILRPLHSIKHRKLKVWIVIDACRWNPALDTFAGRSQTDFKILLSCDPGRYAVDDQSLADAVIRALQDPEKDVEAVCNEAQNQVQSSTRGFQGPWTLTRGNFIAILLPASKTETYAMSQELLTNLASLLGLLGAIFVAWLFHFLLNHIDMSCAVGGPRDAGYPWITFFLDICWHSLNARLLYSRFQEGGLNRWDLLLVVVVSGLNAASPMVVWRHLLSKGTILIMRSLKYNVINTCMLTSSISMLLRLLSLQPRHPNDSRTLGSLFKHLLPYFLVIVFVLQCFILINLSPTDSQVEDSKTPFNLYKKGSSTTLFLLSLILGTISSGVACWLAGEDSLKSVVWQFFLLKLGWCFCRCLHWRWVCLNFAMSNEYQLLVKTAERLAALQVLRLAQRFSEVHAELANFHSLCIVDLHDAQSSG